VPRGTRLRLKLDSLPRGARKKQKGGGGREERYRSEDPDEENNRLCKRASPFLLILLVGRAQPHRERCQKRERRASIKGVGEKSLLHQRPTCPRQAALKGKVPRRPRGSARQADRLQGEGPMVKEEKDDIEEGSERYPRRPVIASASGASIVLRCSKHQGGTGLRGVFKRIADGCERLKCSFSKGD